MTNDIIPQIPTYLVAAIALLLAVEYFGRFCRTKGHRNYAFLGKALMRLYFAGTSLAMYLDTLSIAFRHNLTRYGLFALLLFDLLYMAVEHWQQAQGDERRNDWLKLCHPRGRKGKP